MIEPQPKAVSVSTLAERDVRVGIVLSEDALSTADLFVCGESVVAKNNEGVSHSIPAGTKLQISVSGERLTLSYDSAKPLPAKPPLSGEEIRIIPSSNPFPSPTLTIDPIIAGRSFHWKKTVKADFPGEFLFSARDGALQCVNSLPFEQYLACVVVSEMSSGAPAEFVKTQTVAARSWAVCFLNEKHPGEEYELCNDDDCQRYHGVTFADSASLQSALETSGEYLVTDKGTVLPAYYSKSCGGVTETPEETFGFPVYGLISVTDGECSVSPSDLKKWVNLSESEAPNLYCAGPKEELEKLLGGVDDMGEYFRWDYQATGEELATYLHKHSYLGDAEVVTALRPNKRGPSGRIHELEIEYRSRDGTVKSYVSCSQYEIRSLLHDSFLFSSAFTVEGDESSFVFRGAGWGHGVGLCQIGGTFQAIQGRSYEEILSVYFPAVTIQKCY